MSSGNPPDQIRGEREALVPRPPQAEKEGLENVEDDYGFIEDEEE